MCEDARAQIADAVSLRRPRGDILRIVDGQHFLNESDLGDGALLFVPVDKIGPGDSGIVRSEK